MFWSSVIHGLGILTFWETWAASLFYFIPWVGGLLLTGALARKNGLAGCLTDAILRPILQSLGTILYVVTLAPILLGSSTDAAWNASSMLLVGSPAATVGLVALVVIASMGASFVPVIGQVGSVTTAVGGCVMLGVLVQSLSTETASSAPNVWPGLSFALGFFVLGSLAGWLLGMGLFMASSFFGERMSSDVKFDEDSASTYLGMAIAGLTGHLSVFMYGAWLQTGIR